MYAERSRGSSACLELDGKFVVDIKADRDMDISSADDGLNILLDKKTFEDLAEEYFEEGDSKQVYNCLLAGMRCRLTSRNFELLGEYWYVKGEFEKALQACDMSLDLEPNNYSATCLKALIKGNDTSSENTGPSKDSNKISSPADSTQSNKLADVLALMAAHRYFDAISLLNPMIALRPEAWREVYLREQCYRALKDTVHAEQDFETSRVLEYKASKKGT